MMPKSAARREEANQEGVPFCRRRSGRKKEDEGRGCSSLSLFMGLSERVT